MALLGVEGIDRAGLWNSLCDVVSLQRAVIRASALSVVLADAVKFGRRAAEYLGRASEVDKILTDVSASEFEAAGLRPGQRLNLTKGGTKP